MPEFETVGDAIFESGHLVLLGDSIFDNAAYVPGGPSVIEHLRQRLPQGWRASLLAVDGATVSMVPRQIEQLPPDTTHLVLSVGGNDALYISGDVLSTECRNAREALGEVAEAIQGFAQEYRGLIRDLVALRKPLAVCTIYDTIPGLQPAEIAGLAVYNDVITRTAIANRLTLIDLRVICNEVRDYSALSPIEPSVAGGDKIAQAIIAAHFSPDAGSRVIGPA